MHVSGDTFELGEAIGQLLQNDGAGAKTLLAWNPEQLAQRLETERLGGHVDQLLRSVAADAYVGSAHESALAPLVSAMQFDWIRREEALSQLVTLFEQNGIRAAFLKGIVWAETLYQRPFDRSASDIDILISERDALHFHQVMQRAGYRYRDDKHTFASNEFGYHPRDDAYPFQIDVHWSLCDLYAQEPVNLKNAFKRAIPWAHRQSANVQMLCPVDDILWHCWHRTSTAGDISRLRSLIDLSLLAHDYREHTKELHSKRLSPIEREAVISTFSDTAAILGKHAVPAAWKAWIAPEGEPYARATAVLEARRRFQAIRHRITSASSSKEGLRRLWETGLPPKRWLEINTGKTGWNDYLYTCSERLLRGARTLVSEKLKV
jgi:hypothetical protein